MAADARVPTFPSEFNIGQVPDQAIPCYLRRTDHLPNNKTTATASTRTTDEITIPIDTSTPGAFIDPSRCFLQYDLEIWLVDKNKQAFCQFGKAGVHGLKQEYNEFCQGVPLQPIAEYGMLLGQLMDMYGITGGSTGNIVRQMQAIPTQHSSNRFIMDNYQGVQPEYYGQPINHPDDQVHSFPDTLQDAPQNIEAALQNASTTEIRYDATWTDPNGKVHNLNFQAAGQLSSCNKKRVVVTYKVPIMSGILGTANRHMFPAFLIPSGALSINIKLARANEAMTSMSGYNILQNGTGGYILQPEGVVPAIDPDSAIDYYELRNIRFVAQQVILSEDLASAVIRRAMNNDISIATTSWRHTSTYIRNAIQQEYQIILQHKVASAKMTLYAFRDQNAIGKPGVLPYCRTSFGQTYDPTTSATWQLRIGNDTYPAQKPAESATDTLVELEQAMQQWGDLRHETGLQTQYLHTNTNGYCSDFSNNLWHSDLRYIEGKVDGDAAYPFGEQHSAAGGDETVASPATYSLKDYNDGTDGRTEVILNPAGVEVNDLPLNNEYRIEWGSLGWYEWVNGEANGKGTRRVPEQLVDLRQKEILIIRMQRFYDNVAQDAPEDYLHFQWTVPVADLEGMSAVDVMAMINEFVATIAARGAKYYADEGIPLIVCAWGDADNTSTSNSQTSTNKYVKFYTNPKGKNTFPFAITMSPGLSDCLGFKPYSECLANSSVDYVFFGHDINPYEFGTADRWVNNGNAPVMTVPWDYTFDDQDIGYFSIRRLMLWNKVAGQELYYPANWYGTYLGKTGYSVTATHEPYNLSAIVHIRPLTCYSNALIAINHESFDDQGGKLRSGRLLGNNTLYLELKKAAFRRQWFADYRNLDKPDNHLLLYPTFAQLAQMNELDVEGGGNIRLDSHVHHDLRVSIQAGGVVVSFY